MCQKSHNSRKFTFKQQYGIFIMMFLEKFLIRETNQIEHKTTNISTFIRDKTVIYLTTEIVNTGTKFDSIVSH